MIMYEYNKLKYKIWIQETKQIFSLETCFTSNALTPRVTKL